MITEQDKELKREFLRVRREQRLRGNDKDTHTEDIRLNDFGITEDNFHKILI